MLSTVPDFLILLVEFVIFCSKVEINAKILDFYSKITITTQLNRFELSQYVIYCHFELPINSSWEINTTVHTHLKLCAGPYFRLPFYSETHPALYYHFPAFCVVLDNIAHSIVLCQYSPNSLHIRRKITFFVSLFSIFQCKFGEFELNSIQFLQHSSELKRRHGEKRYFPQ